MAKVKALFNSKPYENVDPVSLSDLMSQELTNGYMDESNSSLSFPGVTLFLDLGIGFGKGIDGMYWWAKKKKMVVVGDGRLFTIDNAGGAFTEYTGFTFLIGVPVSFIDNGLQLIAANGGPMAIFDGTTLAAISDPAAPTSVTHVEFLDTYILAINKNDDKLFYSEVSDATDWDGLNFISAEGNPDDLNSMKVNYQEINLFGGDSLQLFYDDGVTPFAKLSGGFVERGCSAGYSVVKANNSLFWLDHDKRVVTLEGRTPKILSTPFDKLIAGFDVVSDAIGMDVRAAGKHFYVLTFPTENVTLAYNYFLDAWSKLGEWDTLRGIFDRWIGNNFEKSVPWGLDLIGSRADGKIYKLTADSYQGPQEKPLRLVRQTGQISYGTNQWKLSEKLVIHVRRGDGTSSTAPVVQIRYRDNGSSTWSNYIDGNLGKLGDKEFFITFEPLGTYRTRQYEIVVTDNVPSVLVGVEETIEV